MTLIKTKSLTRIFLNCSFKSINQHEHCPHFVLQKKQKSFNVPLIFKICWEILIMDCDNFIGMKKIIKNNNHNLHPPHPHNSRNTLVSGLTSRKKKNCIVNGNLWDCENQKPSNILSRAQLLCVSFGAQPRGPHATKIFQSRRHFFLLKISKNASHCQVPITKNNFLEAWLEDIVTIQWVNNLWASILAMWTQLSSI